MSPQRFALVVVIAFAALLAAGQLHAQTVSDLRVWIEPDPVRVGDPFQLYVEGPGAIEDVAPPGPDALQGDLVVLSTRQQTQTNIVGSEITSTFTKVFTMRAQSAGRFTIGPLDVIIGGKTIKTPIVESEALEPERLEIPDLGVVGAGRAINHPHAAALTEQLEGNAIAVVEAPDSAVVGEVIRVNTYMYRSEEVPSWADGPDIADWGGGSAFLQIAEASQIKRRPVWESVQVGDRNWQRTLISTAVLSPTRAGNLTVSSAEFVVSFPLAGRSRDPFGGLISMRNFVDVIFDGAEVPITVKQLPDPGTADAQVVGNISAGALVDRSEMDQGDLVTLTVRLSGSGYLKPVAFSGPPQIDGLDFLSEEVGFSLDSAGIPLVSTKTFEYTYQAARPGDFSVPNLAVAVVDPETGRQTIRETQEINLRVNPSDQVAIAVGGDPALPQDRARARTLGDDVLFDATPPSGRIPSSQPLPAYRHPIFWAAQGSVLLLGFGLAVVTIRKRHLAADPRRTTALRAWQKSRQAIERAEAAKGGNDREAFYHALSEGVLAAVAAATGREASGLTIEETGQELRRLNIDETLCQSTGELLDRAAAIRYAPDTGETARTDDLETARAAIAAIEEATR